MPHLLGQSAALIALLLASAWVLSLVRRDAGVIDLFWGLGFILVAWGSFVAAEPSSRDALPPLLTTIWGLRLSGYLAWRNHGRPEDYRYRALRDRHGPRFPIISLFTVFALQGVVMWVVSLPLPGAQIDPATQPVWQIAGAAVWLAGLVFESVGDWQLARFKSDPAHQGQVMDRGLWRYTRHPNYFGDFLVWWGLYAVCVGAGAPWWTAVGPAVMSVFLMKVSGVTLLEQTLRQTKPGYAEYERTTNAFFPGPSRPR
jgi:steroid 5-alpha reductase family enzyme